MEVVLLAQYVKVLNLAYSFSFIDGYCMIGLVQWLYPDAHDAEENLGDQLEAYYDEKTKRWVFPGEVIILVVIYPCINRRI